MEAKYSETFETNVHMTDAGGNCRASEILRLMQEAANRQLEHRGPTMAELRAQGRAFILSRISVDIHRTVAAYEHLDSVSWPCSTSRGASFDRCYRLVDEKGAAAAQASSQWALLDVESRRLIRYENSGVDYADDDQTQVTIPLRFRIPKDAELIEVGRKEILYSDADKNMHMNNTHYPDVYCDRLPMEGMRVSAFAIAFLREAPLGDTITVFRTKEPDENGIYWFRTVRSSDSTVNTEAAVQLMKL